MLADRYRLFLANRFFGDLAPYTGFTEVFDSNLPLEMNLGFPREVAKAVDGFDVELGPRPEAHLGLEDRRFIRCARKARFRAFYLPSMIVRHHIEGDRVTSESVRQQAYFSGRGACRERYGGTAREPAIHKIGPSLMFLAELGYSTLWRALFALSSRSCGRNAVVARLAVDRRTRAAYNSVGEGGLPSFLCPNAGL